MGTGRSSAPRCRRERADPRHRPVVLQVAPRRSHEARARRGLPLELVALAASMTIAALIIVLTVWTGWVVLAATGGPVLEVPAQQAPSPRAPSGIEPSTDAAAERPASVGALAALRRGEEAPPWSGPSGSGGSETGWPPTVDPGLAASALVPEPAPCPHAAATAPGPPAGGRRASPATSRLPGPRAPAPRPGSPGYRYQRPAPAEDTEASPAADATGPESTEPAEDSEVSAYGGAGP
jgi:hypothetical protein